MMGPKPCPLLAGIASMVARIQTTGDRTSCTCSRCEKEGGRVSGQEVQSSTFPTHVIIADHVATQKRLFSFIPQISLLYAARQPGRASQPGFTRSSPSLSLPLSRPASPSSPFLPSLLPLLCFSPSSRHLREYLCPDRCRRADPSSARQRCASAELLRIARGRERTQKTRGAGREVGNEQKESARFSPLRQEHPDDQTVGTVPTSYEDVNRHVGHQPVLF